MRTSSILLVLLLSGAVGIAPGQTNDAAKNDAANDVFFEQWRAARAKQPAGLDFTISLGKPTFMVGEAIPVEVALNGAGYHRRFQELSHVGRYGSFVQFRVDREGWEDPLAAIPAESPIMGGSFSMPPLPLRQQLILNEWVRFLRPGRYRVYAQTDALLKDAQVRLQAAGTATSNVLTIDIANPPSGWAEQQLEAARQELAAAPAGNRFMPLPVALAKLAFLDLPEAEDLLLANFGRYSRDYDRRAGDLLLARSRNAQERADLLTKMRAMLEDPSADVTEVLIDALSTLSVMVEGSGKGALSEEALRINADYLEKIGPEQAATLQWRRAEAKYREEYFDRLPPEKARGLRR